MDVSIYGENEEVTGVRVIDNNGVEHEIEVERDGDVYAHNSDGYPDDPADQTQEEAERIRQARRLARFYLHLDRGYDTVSPPDNPVRINAVRHAIQRMDLDEFEEFFGDLYRQFRHDYHPEEPAAVEVPPDAGEPIVYCRDIYLGIDPIETDLDEEAADLAAQYGFDITEQSVSEIDTAEMSEEELENWAEFSGDLQEKAAEEGVGLWDGAYIDEVSEIYFKYPKGGEVVTIDDHIPESAREPDTIFESFSIDPDDLQSFKEFVDYYLRCQIRDCFVGMGLTPPPEFRVIGYGKFMYARRYIHYDIYPQYHDPQADVSGWNDGSEGDDEDDDGLLGIF